MRSEAGPRHSVDLEPGDGDEEAIEEGEDEQELPSELRAGDIVVYHLPKNWQKEPAPKPKHDEGEEEEVQEQGAHRTAMVTMVYLNRRKTKVCVDLTVFLAAGDDPGSRHGTLEVREAVYHPECPPGTFCDVDAESDDLPTAGDLQGIVDKEEAKKEERKEKVKQAVGSRKPDQSLPGDEPKPDQDLPGRRPGRTPGTPGHPEQGLPEDPARPGHDLPGQPARPTQPIAPEKPEPKPGQPGNMPGDNDREREARGVTPPRTGEVLEQAKKSEAEKPTKPAPGFSGEDMDAEGADPLGGVKPQLKEGQGPKASPPEKGVGVRKPGER